jgi:CrcB protein
VQRSALSHALLVGIGGFLGSSLRYLVSGWVHGALPGSAFPWGTLVVNVLGCLAIGFLGGLADFRGVFGPGQRVFLFIGVLGGFTTYSSFAYETLALAREADLIRALLNAALQLLLGIGAAWLGYAGAVRLDAA